MSLSQSIASRKRFELVGVAQAMLDGNLHLIEGVRRICALRHAAGVPDHEMLMPLRAVESETDHFPLGTLRASCAADYLQRMDVEMNQYIDDAKQDIMSACEKIIVALS